MLNSILNGDWSNSVPGRQFPKGEGGDRPHSEHSRVTDHTDYSEFSADRSDRPSIPWKVEICLSCTSNTGHRCYSGEHWRGQMEGVDERTEECRATDEVCEKRKMK